MVALQYPAVMTKDENGTWLVTFPDFDDAVTFGDTREEAARARRGRFGDGDYLSDEPQT